MTTPQLRFSGFEGLWEYIKLVDKIETILDFRGKSPTKFGMQWGNEGYLVLSALNVKDGFIDKSVDAKYGNQELYNKWMGTERLNKDDVIFTTEAPLGNVAQVPDDNGYILNQRVVGFKNNPRILNNDFLAQLLRNPKFKITLKTNSSGGTAKGIGMKEFAKLMIYLPTSIEEQEKIGEFLKVLDKKIQYQQEKVDLLKKQKKGFVQKIFSQEVRFKAADKIEFPLWRKYKLSDFTERVVRKNKGKITSRPLTISAQFGLIDQEEFFKKTVASENLEGYYLLNKGEFAYNKSYSAGYPLGTIKRLDKYNEGALSTLYICFKALFNVDSDFLVHYFESDVWHKEVSMICVEGARNHGLLNVSVSEFFETLHTLPSKEEQQVIAEFLNRLNSKIELSELLLENLLKQKQGLMQQMFI